MRALYKLCIYVYCIQREIESEDGDGDENEDGSCCAVCGYGDGGVCPSRTDDREQTSHVNWYEQLGLRSLLQCPSCPRPPPLFFLLPQTIASSTHLLHPLGLLRAWLIWILGYAGINYSSPTLGTAMLNLIPAFTFILAIIFRMERLDWRSSSGLAKCMGTIVSIAGASIVTFYKGPPIVMTHSSSNLSRQLLLSQQSNWVLGGLFLAVDCVLASSFLIIQAKILKKYPAELVVVFYYFFFVAIQSAAICLIFERDSSAWSLKPNTRFISILYSAVFGSVFQVGVSTWCLHRTGPVFVSMFKPFGIAIAVSAGVIFFGDTFYLGSLVGAIVIVVGFYSVMWGKAEEEIHEDSGVKSLESASPLLQNITEEI